MESPQTIESLALHGSLETLILFSQANKALNLLTNTTHVLDLLKAKYRIETLDNIAHLMNYQTAVKYDLIEVVIMLLPPLGSNVRYPREEIERTLENNPSMKFAPTSTVPDNLIPSLISFGCMCGSYEVVINLMQKCYDELNEIDSLENPLIRDYCLTNYVDIFLQDILKTCNLEVYRCFSETVGEHLFEWHDESELVTYSLAHSIYTGDDKPLICLEEFVFDYLDYDDLLLERISQDFNFGYWLYAKGWISRDQHRKNYLGDYDSDLMNAIEQERKRMEYITANLCV